MLCVNDFERHASEHLKHSTWEFFSMGSEKEVTLQENTEAFKRYFFVPRMLRNVRRRDLSVQVLGEKIDFPICLAPTAYQRLAHPDGEIAALKAATTHGTLYTLSTLSTTSLEDISRLVPKSKRWMQIYMMRDRETTKRMVQKVEQHGFKALVLTIDTPTKGLQLRLRGDYPSVPSYMSMPIVSEVFDFDPALQRGTVPNIIPLICDTLTWEDVAWLKSISALPIVLKGILTAEDAKLAVENGASAVWVSNHGGRQLDGTEATIDALEAVVKALDGTDCEVYMDGGIRWGSDVLKALALGARAVFVGRPLLWGLAHSGENGVRRVLEILKDELNLAMNLSGCRDLSEVGPSLLRKRCPSKM